MFAWLHAIPGPCQLSSSYPIFKENSMSSWHKMISWTKKATEVPSPQYRSYQRLFQPKALRVSDDRYTAVHINGKGRGYEPRNVK